MKFVMRNILSVGIIALLAGCYTELATVEQTDRYYSYESDTLDEGGNTVINNHYYLDDDYRRSRLRVSFNYYYPSYSSWISSYYYSYFDDHYWGMYHRPRWYYDPFYSNYSYYPPYGWCYYPTPVYDPWYTYYPPVIHYPVYGSGPYSGSVPFEERRRSGGGTHITGGSDSRTPVPTQSGTTPSSVAVEKPNPDTERDARNVERKKETPWWERLNTDRPGSQPSGEAVPVPTGREAKPSRGNDPAAPPSIDRQNPTGEDRPVDRPKKDRSADRPKRDERTYTPPIQQPVPSDDARPVDRPREKRQRDYSPAPSQSPPPQSAPPRSSGGTSSGDSRRKKD